MSRSISIFGLGYVGAVTAACLARLGHTVIGVDISPFKVQTLADGRSPIVEAGIEELIREAHEAGRLTATTSAIEAIRNTEISFISVGTPSQRNGKLDLTAVEHVCREIGQALRTKDSFHYIVMRSTVLPGTNEDVVIPMIERASGKRLGSDFAVCSNPEFLREGSAVSDFFNPPFTVIGAKDISHLSALREIYSFAQTRIFETSLKTAEMVKYVCNAFHALKVSFGNEVAALCNELSIDAELVTDIYTSDTKLNISKAYLRPGFAFGGSCLPKDLKAITYCAKELDLHLPLFESIMPSNDEHIDRAAEVVLSLNKRRIGVVGLSFKAGTDDLRNSPMVQLVKRLLGEGCQLKIWDPNVVLGQLIGSNRQFIQDTIPHIGSLLCNEIDELLAHSEIVLHGTGAMPLAELAPRLGADKILVNLQRPDTMPKPARTLAAVS